MVLAVSPHFAFCVTTVQTWQYRPIFPPVQYPPGKSWKIALHGETITIVLVRGKKTLLGPNLPEQQKNVFYAPKISNQISKPGCLATFNKPQAILH